MEYKFVELMSLQYMRSPEDDIQHQITYRYNAMKASEVLDGSLKLSLDFESCVFRLTYAETEIRRGCRQLQEFSSMPG